MAWFSKVLNDWFSATKNALWNSDRYTWNDTSVPWNGSNSDDWYDKSPIDWQTKNP